MARPAEPHRARDLTPFPGNPAGEEPTNNMNMMNDEQMMTVNGGGPLGEIPWDIELAYQMLQEQEKKAADAFKLTFAAQGMAQ